MKIGIDARYLSHGLMGGVHTYIQQFVPRLIKLASQHEIVLYADTKNAFELDTDAMPSYVSVRRLPYRTPLSTMQYDLFLGKIMAKDGLDVAHFPANVGWGKRQARTIVTLHDSLTILPLSKVLRGNGSRRTLKNIAMTVYLNTLSPMSVHKADLLLTVSQHARQDIAAHSGFDVERIVAIPHAPGEDMQQIQDPERLAEVRQRLNLPSNFVLADALKNPAVLVAAWRRLPAALRANRKIVFFSRHPSPLPIVFEAVASGDAQLLIRPSRADLIALYNMAEVFVFPSWFEGFGIPVLEAMKCGTPVIASDRYSIPEVANGAALIADCEDDEAFAAHLMTLLEQPNEAERLRQLGLAHAHSYSWDRTAAEILESYERAYALPKRLS